MPFFILRKKKKKKKKAIHVERIALTIVTNQNLNCHSNKKNLFKKSCDLFVTNEI